SNGISVPRERNQDFARRHRSANRPQNLSCLLLADAQVASKLQVASLRDAEREGRGLVLVGHARGAVRSDGRYHLKAQPDLRYNFLTFRFWFQVFRFWGALLRCG